MENTNKKKTTICAAIKRTVRAWKLFWKIMPGWFVATFLKGIFSAITPYVTIWFSARLINELAGGRDPMVLRHYVIWILASSAVLMLANAVFERWYKAEDCTMWSRGNIIYMQKLLNMDFVDIDSQSVYDLYMQIMQSQNYAAWGLMESLSLLESIVPGIFQIIGGIGLSVSLFSTMVPDNSKGLLFLNSPLSIIVIVSALMLAAAASPWCATKGSSYWSRFTPQARFENRFLSFFGFVSTERKRAADLRMYEQQENVCNVYSLRNNAFGPHSLMAKWARGPMGLWRVASAAISVLLTGVIYLFVCLKAYGGAFGLGSVTQYIGAITTLFIGISAMLETLGNMRINAEFLETTYELIDMPNRMYQGTLTTEKRNDRKYEVEFRDVSFKYPGSDSYALRHVNMKFKIGSRLAVVGMNGSGKTTFIKLLCRLYDPTEGQILLNGIDIRKYRYDDYISIFSVVFQDFKLFSLPLGQNVAASRNYDAERVKDCLVKAGFGDKLEHMPNGLDAYLYKDIDKEGVEISGGEAQKIAIARALYKDAPFIVLDEPTAALDPVAEAEIYEKFNDIAGDKTAIYISHRLSSCKFCDEIAVFHNGEVIQQGTHESLVADESGKYYELWNAQAQYYAEEQADE